jgi:hypothetical protein
MSIIPRPVQKMEPSPTHGWVYIIKSDSGHYKIGKSIRPDKRVTEFSLKLPFKIEIIDFIECENHHQVERFLHELCAEYHVNGEWFLLPELAVVMLSFLYRNGIDNNDLFGLQQAFNHIAFSVYLELGAK